MPHRPRHGRSPPACVPAALEGSRFAASRTPRSPVTSTRGSHHHGLHPASRSRGHNPSPRTASPLPGGSGLAPWRSAGWYEPKRFNEIPCPDSGRGIGQVDFQRVDPGGLDDRVQVGCCSQMPGDPRKADILTVSELSRTGCPSPSR